MAPTPHRTAHTSTELKRLHRKNGPLFSERQRKQLARELELNQRAAQAREAEERRKAAAKKRKEKEAKETAARRQLGVGLATQMIGYSHTQAQLKNGMEAFLGLKKKKDEEKRQKELELTKKLEEAVATIEKEPWDDDEDDIDNACDLPEPNASLGEQWADDDLDDDSLLEAHNLVMSDSVEEPPLEIQPEPALASHTGLALPLATTPPKPHVKESLDFTRTHGPINKSIEAVLDKLPGPLVELLSQDLSLKTPEWDPAVGLLHKLNPVGLPQHRLRIKVGCVVTLLKDLNKSSQLSKSQHLRVLRSENDRLECQVLDGQLRGTKTFLTRIPFHAKYKNLEQHLFQRTQFPICVSLDYTASQLPRETSQAGFKAPSVPGRIPPAVLPRRPTLPISQKNTQALANPGFKLPGLPASKCNSPANVNTVPTAQPVQAALPPTDCWDDFFESSTQISREIGSEERPQITKTDSTLVAPSLSMTDDHLPPMSTQDLDFPLDELDDELNDTTSDEANLQPPSIVSKKLSATIPEKAVSRPTQGTFPMASTVPPVGQSAMKLKRENAVASTRTSIRSSVAANSSRPLSSTRKIAGKCLNPGPFATTLAIELAKLRPSQLPKSMPGPPAKRKATTTLSNSRAPPTKKPCMADSHPSKIAATTEVKPSFDDFVMSTQEAASFFDDDDNLSFGSPPIAV